MLSYGQAHCDLFSKIPSQSRFNRRRRNLMQAFNLIRHIILQSLDLAQDRQCVIDSVPIPVVQFHLVLGASSEWKVQGADYGRVASKITIYGYKQHPLATLERCYSRFHPGTF